VAAPERDRDPTFERILGAMRAPAFYGAGEDEPVTVAQTHISWVFAIGERAYKLKKPVTFSFLDYSSAQRRREMCEREVELNRRLAAETYLGVRGVTLAGGAPRLAREGEEAVEWLVEMRRFDPADTLAAAIAAGRAGAATLEAVGRRLAGFHAAAGVRAPPAGDIEHVKRAADDNLESLLGAGPLAPRRVFAAQRFVDAMLERHRELIAARGAAGRVRDGHGDLRAEHVLLGEPLQILDAVEFDAGLRAIDVGADLAFLVMDVTALGRPDLARALVDGYRAAGGDPGPDELLALHAANRAWVRAKVALADGPSGDPEVRARFALGERLAWRARLPLLVIVCGAPATGKSTLAQALAQRSGLTLVSSDATRKRLAGIGPTERAPAEAYGAAAGERTYAALGAAAGELCIRERGAIVDATFARARERRAFAAALRGAPAPRYVECRVPAAVAQARARERERDPKRVSDAGPRVAAELREAFEPLEDEVAARDQLVLRTDRPLEHALEELLARLDERLAHG